MDLTQAVTGLITMLSAINKARSSDGPLLSVNFSDLGLIHLKNDIKSLNFNFQIGQQVLVPPREEMANSAQDEARPRPVTKTLPLIVNGATEGEPIQIPSNHWPFETGLYLIVDTTSQKWLQADRTLTVGERNALVPILADHAFVDWKEIGLRQRQLGVEVRAGVPVALHLGWKDSSEDGGPALSMYGTYAWELSAGRALKAGRSTWQLESAPLDKPLAMNNDLPAILQVRSTVATSAWRLVRSHPGRPDETYWLVVVRCFPNQLKTKV